MYSNAAGYDSYMGRWSEALALQFLSFCCWHTERFLDLGCGTGILSRAIQRWFPACQVVGLDPCLPFLLHARRHTDFAVNTVTGLAEALPFREAIFDHCLSLLVLQEIEDRPLALGEMCRVTKVGGIVAACQWDFARGMPMTLALRRAIAAVAPEHSDTKAGGASRAFDSLEELRHAWTSAGLEAVETALLSVTISFGNFCDFWDPLLSGSTPMLAVFASLDPADREAVRGQLRHAFLGSEVDGSFSITAHAFAVRGMRPLQG
jgi:ubiquinone/menaquinone biosynthesis C-methylase UbiE